MCKCTNVGCAVMSISDVSVFRMLWYLAAPQSMHAALHNETQAAGRLPIQRAISMRGLLSAA